MTSNDKWWRIPAINEEDPWSTEEVVKHVPLLSLDDACLERIFNYLSSEDQFLFSMTCERFFKLFPHEAHEWSNWRDAFLSYFHHTNSWYLAVGTGSEKWDGPMAPLNIPFLRLNYYCLLVIYKLLSSDDKYSFSMTCRRFYECFTPDRHEGKPWDFMHAFSQAEVIDSVVIESHGTAEMNGEVFSKAHTFDVPLESSIPSFHKVGNWLKSFQNVSIVNLRGWNLQDNDVKLLWSLPLLEDLDISRNRELTGCNIAELHKLKRLILTHCTGIQSGYFREIYTSLSLLRCLNIFGCWHLHSSVAFNEMQYICENLENFKLSCRKDMPYHLVGWLPKLKVLQLCVEDEYNCEDGTTIETEDWSILNDCVRPNMFKYFAQLNQLEFLQFEYDEDFTVEDFAYISEITTLKVLSLPRFENFDIDHINAMNEMHNLQYIRLASFGVLADEASDIVWKKCPNLKAFTQEGRGIDDYCY